MGQLTPEALEAKLLKAGLNKPVSKSSKRVHVNQHLLSLASTHLSEEYHDNDPVSFQNVIVIALINVLNRELKDAIIAELSKDDTYSTIVTILQGLTNDNSNTSVPNLSALKRIESQNGDILTLLYTLLVSDTWLLQDRAGLNVSRGKYAKTPTDLFNLLRDDDLKGVIEKVLLAGASERQRQDHLNK